MYVVQAADVGSTITVIITRPVYTTGQITSPATATVTAAPVTPPPPGQLSVLIQNHSNFSGERVNVHLFRQGQTAAVQSLLNIAHFGQGIFTTVAAGNYVVRVVPVDAPNLFFYFPASGQYTFLSRNVDLRFTGNSVIRTN